MWIQSWPVRTVVDGLQRPAAVDCSIRTIRTGKGFRSVTLDCLFFHLAACNRQILRVAGRPNRNNPQGRNNPQTSPRLPRPAGRCRGYLNAAQKIRLRLAESGKRGRGPWSCESKFKAPMQTFSKLKRLLRSSWSSPVSGSRHRRSSPQRRAALANVGVESLEVRQLLAGVAGGPPDVFITKGVVASTDPTATFDSATGPVGVVFAEPGTSDAPFGGVISTDGIRTGIVPQSLNANLTNANAGDIVRYAVLLENRSAVGGAFDVTLQDSLPAGVTYVPGSLQVVDGAGQQLTFRDLTGATDGAGLFTSGIQLDDPGATQGAFFEADHCGAIDGLTADAAGRNIAIAFYDVTVENVAGNTALLSSAATLANFSQTEGGANLSTSPVESAAITLERIDLEITKQVSNAAPLLGDAVTWTIDVTNNAVNATSAATGVVVRDLVPAGQSVIAGSAVLPVGGSFDETTGIWTVGQSIVPGGTVRLTFRSQAANSVAFASALVDVELTGQVPLIPVSVGGAVDYSITVTNNSEAATASATGVVIDNLLPAGLSFVTHTVSAGAFNSATGVWDLSTVVLAAGQSETITISTTASVVAAGTVIPFAAAVTTLNETDVDSTAGNTAAVEDDDFTAGVTIRAAAATRSVSGVAFLDANNDGANVAETGVANITVNAYAPDGTLSGTAITDVAGSYTIANVTTEAVRLEFIGFDRQQSVTTAQAPPASATTFSSLAFLDAGTAGLTADLALYRPTTQAMYVTTCFVYSGQSTLDPTLEPAVYTFNADGSVRGTLATVSQVGATNGLALHAASGDHFVGAFQKRHSDIGPDGNSAIYRISSTGVVSTFIKLDDFFGADSAGAYSHDPANWSIDAPAFDAVGKTAFGDVEISADGQFLYTINLATRELIEIPIGTGGSITPVDYLAGDTRVVRTVPILGDALAAPTNGGIALQDLGVDPTTNIRPFALGIRDGLVYVGMVNSAESTTDPADLAAFVYVFDPVTGQFRTTPASAFPLGTRVNGGGWQEWATDFSALPTFYDAAGDFFVVGNAQPWLTDIEFDNNGDMVLGFRDRIGDQIGHMTGDLTGSDSDGSGAEDRFYHDTRGEILRLRQATVDTWTVEPGHTAGDTTEYYVGDEALFDPASPALHPEVGQGGLVQIPGFNDIVTTAIDPESFFAGGIVALDNATGAQVDALDVYTGSDLSDLVTFGKNNGLGDLEYANNLTIEIGNRVWNDVDKDGIQAAGEAAFANVDLALFDVTDPANPLQVGTTTTNAAGEYYFNDSNVSYTDGGDAVGLRALTDYEIRVSDAEFLAGGTLDQFRVTARDQSPVLVPLTTQAVTGTAAFDSDLDLALDTARSQRIDVLTSTGLAADGVRVVVTNATGGLARVESDGTVVFDFSDGSVAGTFEYVIEDDRIDSDATGFDDDADGVTDRAVVAFTSGATGSTDHSLDLGFVETKVDLELSKLSTRKFAVEGDSVTFVVTLSNNALTADAPATGVTVTDVLPAGLTFVAGSVIASQGTFDGTTWTLPIAIFPGDVATLSYRAIVGGGTAGTVLVNSAQVASQLQADVDSSTNNDDGDQSEDDEDNAVVLVGTATNATVVNTAQVSAANEPDFDSTPDNDDHNQSEDDENAAEFTLSTTATAFDFGDLPDVYQTLLASGGPSHRRGTATFLGATIDSDSDGQPSPTAVAEGADDDGVRFLNPLLAGSAATIEVTGSTDGFLNAWIDFDANGTLDELSITAVDGVVLGTPVAADDLALTAGVHTLTIAVPASATGLMAARFRYTSDQMAATRAPGGAHLNGEVEDYVLRQIGDRVWFDHDADGVLDPITEAGLSGVTVVLSADLDGNGVAESYPTTTDANGFYRFDGIPQGSYTVTVTPPASLSATFDLDGGNDNTATVTFADATASRLDVDFGYRGSGLIGDTVWFDANANGALDTGESGISGIPVQLTGDLNGDSVVDVTLTTTTTASGLYEFQNLVPGNYTVTVTPKTGLIPTFDADSIATPNTSQTSLSIGTVTRTQDFGYRGSASIGDTVWVDVNGDGVLDVGEPGIGGVAVLLTGDTNGDSVVDVTLATTTNAVGVYQFANLQPGVYTTTVIPPTGTTQTFDANGLATPNSSIVALAAAAVNRDQDFGFRATTVAGTGLVGDVVWDDIDGDGVIDTGEPGRAGVAVRLTGDLNGDTIIDVTLNTVTNGAGVYEFANLDPGAYTVTVTPSTGTVQTFDNDGLATANNSAVVLTSGAVNRLQDFGYRTATTNALIGDTVWFDADLDGIQDANEPGISGVAVQLTGDTNGDSVIDVTLNTTTNSTGLYEFTSLAGGTYTVTVTPPTGSIPTFDANGVASPNVSTVTLAAGATVRTQDFGYAGNATIGDLIFTDVDNSNSQTTGDTGISGVGVILQVDLNGDSVVDYSVTDTTDAAGLYLFSNLLPGTYSLTVDPATLAGAAAPVVDPDGTNNGSATVTVAGGVSNLTQDFGYPPAVATTVDLVITKDNANPQDLAAIGAVVTYTVIVTNAGTATATNALVTDNLPATFTSATWTTSGTAGTVFTSSGTGNLAETVSLPAGGAITYQVAAQLNGSFTGTVTNTATVTTTQTETDLTNNSASDTTSVSPLTLTVESPLVPGEPFQIGARGMSHVALVPFIVGTQPGSGTINGIAVGIADPQVFMVGFVCVDDRIIGVYDVPANLAGQTLYFQSYESSPTPRLSNVVSGVVGAPRVVATQTGGSAAVVEGSTTDTLSLTLSQAPTSNVVVEVQSQAPERLAVSAASVTFTPTNWNVPQTVTLQAVEDAVFNGDGTVNVQLSIQAGSDAAFVGGFQQVVGVAVSDNDVLSSPVLSNAFVSTQSQQPAITWSEVPGAASYDVWVSSTLDVQNPIVNTNVTGTSFTPSSGLGIGKLAVWVRARTASGRVSPYSAVGRIDVTTAPTIASIPDGIDRRPEITWSAVEGAARYELWVANTTTGGTRVIHDTTLTGTTFLPTADLGLGIYSVWVRAINQSGQVSDWSVVERFNVGVELLSPTAATFDAQPTFTWTAVPGAATYEIYLRVGSTVIRQAGLTTPEFTPSAALAAGTHRWWVRGAAASGTAGGWSSPAEVSVGGQPTITAPTGTASAAPQFTWGAVDGAASYTIYVSLVNAAGNAAASPGLEFQTSSITASSYTHGIPLSNSNATYRVWVRAISASGVLSSWSLPVTFTVASVKPESDGDVSTLLTLFAQADFPQVAAAVRPVPQPESKESDEQGAESAADSQPHDLDLAMAESAMIGW